MVVEDKFVITLGKKKFVLFEGLLNEFHTMGGNSILPVEIYSTPDAVKFRATVSGTKGTFTATGVATKANVGNMVGKFLDVMAETRAVARALRFYTNIGMCSYDELNSDDVDEEEEKPKVNEMKVEVPLVCNSCQAKVTPAEKTFSMKFFYGKVYCRPCQAIMKEQAEQENAE